MRRHRGWLCVALALVIALGLASRRVPGLFPQVLQNYPGDALWAVALFLCIALLRPAMPCGMLASLALIVAWVDEFAQLIQAPWLVALRRTTAGHLVLGSGFDPLDLVAYAIGIALAATVDYLLHRPRGGGGP
ncbi:DUF2809 domain-containing protein [Massilia sp. CF038]|uniref:ribosomal maturation YjgA family protein n=1 Tax=Massilia sp. CF038 TaxID=1881045 RepID=UPI00091640E6|nr:DUF2809 domain-containing protein [Massilia sp. CF038]SHH66448.1 Protein of unknown function [Massilia sp. CF038]